LEDLKPTWVVKVGLEGGAHFQVPVEAGQTYGDVKRQMVNLAQEAAEKLLRATGGANDTEVIIGGRGLARGGWGGIYL
jgi:hypothetical protein